MASRNKSVIGTRGIRVSWDSRNAVHRNGRSFETREATCSNKDLDCTIVHPWNPDWLRACGVFSTPSLNAWKAFLGKVEFLYPQPATSIFLGTGRFAAMQNHEFHVYHMLVMACTGSFNRSTWVAYVVNVMRRISNGDMKLLIENCGSRCLATYSVATNVFYTSTVRNDGMLY